MRKETKKAPTIRFRGFNDDWEQRKLGEIFTERSEKKHEYLPPLTIIQGCGTVRRDEMDRELIYDKSSLSNYKLVKKNDFIVHLRSFEGGLEKSNIEGIVSPAYHIFHGEKINTEFYYSFFRSNDFINHKLVPFVYGIRDGRSIDIAGMKTIKIPYPSVNEQNRIGTLIGQLNSLIAFHQRKLAQLKKLKKYFLQNMFPAKGEKVPRIRFKGFTGDWEQHKLYEIGQIVTGTTPPTSDAENYNGDLLFVSPADIDDNRYITKTITTVSEKGFNTGREIRKGASLFVSIGSSIGKVAQMAEKAITNQQINAVVPNDNYDDDFVLSLLETQSSNVKAIASNQAVPIVNKSTFSNIDILVPPNITEQQKMGKYFANLDNLITLHQRKLDQLQTMKKFMLQNLFI